MNIRELLTTYNDENLDQLARDKIDEVSNVRLPRHVLEREIASALSSFSYVADTLAAAMPPTYALLKVLMDAEDGRLPAATLKEKTLAKVEELTGLSLEDEHGRSLGRRDSKVYRAALRAAWDFENFINKSETNLLETLRSEFGISMREHLALEYHPEVRVIWETPRAFEAARNSLLGRGLVFIHEEAFVLPAEVRSQIRKYWEMELADADYTALLDYLTTRDLHAVLEAEGLQVSGTKSERIHRIVSSMIRPSSALKALDIVRLKEMSRGLQLAVSLPKQELIDRLVQHFEAGGSPRLVSEAQIDDTTGERQLSDHELEELLRKLTGNQLRGILERFGLRLSGSKDERVQRLVESGLPEVPILMQLRKKELVEVCARAEVRASGQKSDLVDRLISAAERQGVVSSIESGDADVAEHHAPEGFPTATIVLSASREAGMRTADQEVSNLREIEQRFPTFSRGEQVVLALLHEARSLTDRDIQRLAARHGLGWTLPKAHMGELLRKLGSDAGAIVKIRSTGSTNIYEWVDAGAADDGQVDKWVARDVIEALRQGVVPERSPEMLVVGQEAARSHLEEQLDYVSTGRSSFKFIRGAYGAGKSFLLSWLRERALNSDFAVSDVRVSADLSMGDLKELYVGLMDGLRTPEKRGASSLSDILEAWLLAAQRQVEAIEGIEADDPSARDKLNKLVNEHLKGELARFAAHDPGFASALISFYNARVSGDEELAAAAVSWIRGNENLATATLRRIGVRGTLVAEQVLPRLRALLDMLTDTHLKGLVILIDELELVRRRPHKVTRDKAYETLRALIDEVGENGLPGTLLISTGTDTFFEDRRYGIASYEALLHRIRPPAYTAGRSSVRQPIIQLDGLDATHLLQVAERTRTIHAAAYDWSAAQRVTDEDLELLVGKWSEFGGEKIDRLPRPFLRQLVHVLDLCEENADLSARECIRDPIDDPEVSEALIQLVMD